VTEVKQKLSFLFGLLLGAALVRVLARQRRPQRQGALDPRVDELRSKLAAQREPARRDLDTPPAAPVAPPPAPSVEQPPARSDAAEEHDLVAERRRIYEQGRAAVDEMRRSGEPREPPP
jgi:hypothetical protein